MTLNLFISIVGLMLIAYMFVMIAINHFVKVKKESRISHQNIVVNTDTKKATANIKALNERVLTLRKNVIETNSIIEGKKS